MQITFWGSRGSIASPGQNTLRYGGNSTCLEIRPREGGVIIVDAGSGIRNLGKKLAQDPSVNELYLLLTHSHWDHLSGFPFFLPAYLARYTINVYGGPKARESLKQYISHQMSPPYFPIEFKHLKAKFNFGDDCLPPGDIGLVVLGAIPLSHPNGGYGFKFTKAGKRLVFLTDNELDHAHAGGRAREDYLDFCRDADLLIHDAQYTDHEYEQTRGWGHTTYSSAVRLALESGAKSLCLFHHDPDRSDDDLDRQVEHCQGLIRQEGSSLECFAAREGASIRL
ncbi:MAG: MBL fold metallo-hydrolase [Elusimicrobiota bacterium]